MLRPVVEVALDTATLGVGCGDDPAARCSHLRELRPHLCREALVLEHEPGCCTNLFHERGLIQQRRIVNERSDLFAACGDRRDSAVVALRHFDRLACRIDVTTVA